MYLVPTVAYLQHSFWSFPFLLQNSCEQVGGQADERKKEEKVYS